MKNTIDPITLEVLWNRLLSVVNEQQVTLMRTAFSTVVRESQDLACGVFDTRGSMIAQSLTGTPGHINAMATSMHHFLAAFPAHTLAPGDVLITNDPWMTAGQTLEYLASFRPHWNQQTQNELLDRFRLNASKKVDSLSKGQKTQLALIGAICPEPDLLILDEPTSGLDPIVRREFIQTIIGAYQESGPTRRTVFVSTHLISEFEGLIDEFTIIEDGRAALTLDADAAREKYKKIRARFGGAPPVIDQPSSTRTACWRRTASRPPRTGRKSRTHTAPPTAPSADRSPCPHTPAHPPELR